MKPDILVTHPRDILYPLWMWRMNHDRDLFGKIIVVMTQKADDRDYTDYIKAHIKDVTVIDSYHDTGQDWRNAALMVGLQEVTSTHVLFLEQDFLVLNGFFHKLFTVGSFEVVGFYDGNRLHPACLLVPMALVKQTRKDFSVDPDKGDHFSKFTQDLAKFGTIRQLTAMKLPKWYHLSGLTQNYRLKKNFHKEDEFLTYVYCSMALEEPIDWWVFSRTFTDGREWIFSDKIYSFIEEINT